MYRNISKARSQLMGIAMLMIMFFHTSIKYPHVLDLIKNFGDFGVNLFFLLSGYSMYYAWKKVPSLKAFYKKRFTRILLTYLPIAIVWCSISVLLHECGVMEAICKILTIQFWIDGNLLHWFVSGILVLYLITPFWIKMHEKNTRICLLVTIGICSACVILSFFNVIKTAIFMYRVPTYFIGLYMGMKSYSNQEPKKKEKIVIYILGVIGIICFACIGFDTLNYTWKYIFYIFLSPALAVLGASILCKCDKVNGVLNFCSLITLETYLLHEKILRIGTMLWNSFEIGIDHRLIMLNIICAIGAVMVAYLYSRIIGKILNFFQ